MRRLQTDVIDLYQIHWPNRNVPMFGGVYFDPANETVNTSIPDQLEAFAELGTTMSTSPRAVRRGA